MTCALRAPSRQKASSTPDGVATSDGMRNVWMPSSPATKTGTGACRLSGDMRHLWLGLIADRATVGAFSTPQPRGAAGVRRTANSPATRRGVSKPSPARGWPNSRPPLAHAGFDTAAWAAYSIRRTADAGCPWVVGARGRLGTLREDLTQTSRSRFYEKPSAGQWKCQVVSRAAMKRKPSRKLEACATWAG